MLAELVAMEGDLGLEPVAIRRLAALRAPADTAERLRLSKADAARLDRARDGIAAALSPAEAAYRSGQDAGVDLLLLQHCGTGTMPVTADLRRVERAGQARLPVVAADLMPGLQGPELGAALKRLEDVWIASDFRMDREALLREL